MLEPPKEKSEEAASQNQSNLIQPMRQAFQCRIQIARGVLAVVADTRWNRGLQGVREEGIRPKFAGFKAGELLESRRRAGGGSMFPTVPQHILPRVGWFY